MSETAKLVYKFHRYFFARDFFRGSFKALVEEGVQFLPGRYRYMYSGVTLPLFYLVVITQIEHGYDKKSYESDGFRLKSKSD